MQYISTVVDVAESVIDPSKLQGANWNTCNAIWDTGATTTCICQAYAEKIGLIAIRETEVDFGTGTSKQPVFAAALHLRGDTGALLKEFIPLIGIHEIPSADMLIGMDIITMGDFAITNHESKTWMSFQYPSSRHIDFSEKLGVLR